MPNAECEMRVERHVEVPKGEHFSVTYMYLGKSVYNDSRELVADITNNGYRAAKI
jgi:hypothetical protein